MARASENGVVAHGCATARRKLAIEYCPTSQLILDPKNPRLHSEKQIRQIARSVETFGFNVPVLVDSNRRVIAGHGRVLACQMLGIKEVPTISLEHLTQAQIRAFMIADNKLTENAAWDDATLGEQLKALSQAELDFSLEATGFEMGEIDVIFEGLAPTSNVERDPADTIPETPTKVQITRIGDLWRLGKHRVLCGNALDPASYTKLMGDKQAATVFTDPPYNVPINGHPSGLRKIQHNDFVMPSGKMSEAEFADFLTQTCRLLAKHSIDGAFHFICIDWRHMSELLAAGRQVFGELENLCVWAKDHAGMGSPYQSQHELVFVFKHGKSSHHDDVQRGRFGRYRSNVWQYPDVNSFARSTKEGKLLALHPDPTLKPVAMVAAAIMDCSARGDIVLDPFLGSGTTVIAAERTGRICHGLELDPTYADTIVRRWRTFTGKSAVHELSGRSFKELEEQAAP